MEVLQAIINAFRATPVHSLEFILPVAVVGGIFIFSVIYDYRKKRGEARQGDKH